MALRPDSVKVLHALYRRGTITEAEQSQLALRCEPDTFAFLQDMEFILKADRPGSPWRFNHVLNTFLTELEGNLESFPPRDYLLQFPITDRYPNPPEVFIAMPYGPPWFQPVRDALERAARSAQHTPQIGNKIDEPGFIMDQVWTQIRRAAAIISDLTECNPNVMYETGIAHALGKPVIFLLQTGTVAPFDIAAQRHIYYTTSNLPKLESDVSRMLQGLPRNPLADVVDFEP